MPAADGARDHARPKVGRPPRISREMIAEAAHEIGLEGLTLRAVADHLDVSIAALYHHVSGKDDLLRLAAEFSVSQVPLPEDRGQHWALWLREWAHYNRDVFLAQPGLLGRYLDGMIPVEAMGGNIDTVLRVLVGQGFTVLDANAAFELVTACALGTAVAALREREAIGAGRTLRTAYKELLANSAGADLPYVRALLKEIRGTGRRSFDEQIATVLRGVAEDQGFDWPPIRDLLDTAAPDPPKRQR